MTVLTSSSNSANRRNRRYQEISIKKAPSQLRDEPAFMIDDTVPTECTD